MIKNSILFVTMIDRNGHRRRLKERFFKVGRAALSDHEVLELLLFYAIPRRDVKDIAKTLLNRFGSLAAVLNADPVQLLSHRGIGENSAVLLKLFHTLKEENVSVGGNGSVILDCQEAISSFLRFREFKAEELLVLMLDNNCRLLDTFSCSGGFRRVLITPADLISRTLHCRDVRQVIIVHNHPGQTPAFSTSDVHATVQIKRMFGMLGIVLADHILICGGKMFSMLKSPYAGAVVNADSNRQKPDYHRRAL